MWIICEILNRIPFLFLPSNANNILQFAILRGRGGRQMQKKEERTRKQLADSQILMSEIRIFFIGATISHLLLLHPFLNTSPTHMSRRLRRSLGGRNSGKPATLFLPGNSHVVVLYMHRAASSSSTSFNISVGGRGMVILQNAHLSV